MRERESNGTGRPKPRGVRGRASSATRSDSTPVQEFERAYQSAPICWAYDSANPRYMYLSRDNRESTKHSFRFDYAEVIEKVKPGRLSKKGYQYFELRA